MKKIDMAKYTSMASERRVAKQKAILKARKKAKDKPLDIPK